MDLDLLIPKLTDKLNEIGIDQYDYRLAYRDLEDAWQTIQMIADSLGVTITDTTVFATYKVERCVIRLGTYHAYRTYTRLVQRQIGTLPEQSPNIVLYDVIDAQNCLSLLFGVSITSDLIPELLTQNIKPVVAGSMAPSILDVE